jgi:hypothetical protein
VISCRRSLLSCTWSIVKTREHVSRMKKFDNIILDIYIYCARRLSKLRRSSSCEHHSRDHDTNCVIDKGLAELLGRHGSFPRNICTLLTSGPASMQHAHLTSSEFRVAAKWAVTLCELHQFRSHSKHAIRKSGGRGMSHPGMVRAVVYIRHLITTIVIIIMLQCSFRKLQR